MNIEQYGIYILYTLIYIISAVILKYALNYKAASLYNADDQMVSGNYAVALRRSGAQFGLAIAIMGVLSGSTSGDLVTDLMVTCMYSLVAIGFIISSIIVTDSLVLPGINNLSEIKNKNAAVGVVEFGMLIATGIIAYSSIVGEGGGIISSLAYFVAGQATLVLLVLFYEKVVLRSFSIVETIGQGNITSGIYLSGKLIAYGLILKSAIAGNATDAPPIELAIEFVSIAVSGMILLYIFEYIIDLLLITASDVKTILSENQVVPALQLTVGKVSVALILSNAIL